MLITCLHMEPAAARNKNPTLCNVLFQIGFDSGDGTNYCSLPRSRSRDIGYVVESSNVNTAGRWVLTLDSRFDSINNYTLTCEPRRGRCHVICITLNVGCLWAYLQTELKRCWRCNFNTRILCYPSFDIPILSCCKIFVIIKWLLVHFYLFHFSASLI